MNININFKRKFKVNGKEYNSIEEMPYDIREAFEKAMASQADSSHQVKPTTMQTKIIFNGTEYKNIDAMPQDVRQLYEKVLKAAETGAVPPDIDIAGDINGMLTRPKTFRTDRTGDIRKPTNTEPSFSPRTLIVSVVLFALILLLYFLFHSR
jgi:hypothetical protein